MTAAATGSTVIIDAGLWAAALLLLRPTALILRTWLRL
jgi:hypothetical protein